MVGKKRLDIGYHKNYSLLLTSCCICNLTDWDHYTKEQGIFKVIGYRRDIADGESSVDEIVINQV